MVNKIYKAVFVLTLVITMPTSLEATNGYRQIGYGVKAKGMGGVGIALPQDAFAAAANPAGMAFLCDRLDFGVHYLRHRIESEIEAKVFPFSEEVLSRNRLYSNNEMWWPEFAINWVYCPYYSLGLSVYAFGGFKIDYNQKSLLGTTSIFETGELEGTDLGMDYQVYFIAPSWSWTIDCTHSIGVAVNIAVGELNISGLQLLQNDSILPPFVSDNGTDWKSGIGLKFGWIGQFDCGVTLGLTYQTRTWMNHFKKYRGFIAEDGNMDLPSIWGLGVTWCVTPCIVLSADFERIMWSDTKMFRHDIENVGLFGSKSGRGFGWEDQTVVKFGAAWDISQCFTVRAGFNYGTNLYGGRDTWLNVLTAETVKHHYTIGATYYNRCYELSINYLHGDGHGMAGRNKNVSNPLLPDMAGSNEAKQDSIGVSYGYRF